MISFLYAIICLDDTLVSADGRAVVLRNEVLFAAEESGGITISFVHTKILILVSPRICVISIYTVLQDTLSTLLLAMEIDSRLSSVMTSTKEWMASLIISFSVIADTYSFMINDMIRRELFR